MIWRLSGIKLIQNDETNLPLSFRAQREIFYSIDSVRRIHASKNRCLHKSYAFVVKLKLDTPYCLLHQQLFLLELLRKCRVEIVTGRRVGLDR